jgi:hypothetical protein
MSTALKTQFDPSWNEADQLISILRKWGITYLVGEGSPIPPSDMVTNRASAVRLIERLVQCEYPRVRDAMISLFLLRPALADAALEALRTSTSATVEQITTLILATLYLQRMWSIRLALALGHAFDFPEEPFAHLWQRRYLPSPAYHDGEWGLTKLQEYEQRKSGLPLNYLRDWQNQVDHLLLQEEFYHHIPAFPVMRLLDERKDDEQEPEMSMRPNVDKGQIENFLKNLGRSFRKPGRLYLVGGAALVHMGIRSGSTQGIDVEIRATNEDEMMEAIRRLKDTLNINIEFASPGDFMPLPKQWEMHAKYIGRYGQIDAFYFDFYSIALSKIQRGSTGDIRDVKLLLEQRIVALPELDEAYNEVLPQVGKRPYGKLDPKQFAERYETIRQLFSLQEA